MVECVIAEDEELLRTALAQQLGQAWPELRVVAQCEDGASALEAIAEHRPDVAFLDIRMPGLTGIEVAAALAQVSPWTQVVFVTAYDQYAIDAFEQGAVDYLLKPVAADRLQATVQRLQSRAAGGRPDAEPHHAWRVRSGPVCRRLGYAIAVRAVSKGRLNYPTQQYFRHWRLKCVYLFDLHPSCSAPSCRSSW